MDRRDFFKISALTGATAALDSCGKPERQLIRFIPEEDLVPGVATWKPSICTLCPAGCGTIVRIMEGDAEVIRNGKLGLMPMGLAKKLEGNPHHPVNQGRLCPRGQAGLQLTYHPDRVRNPLKRSGPRGSGRFEEISWDDAIKELVSQLSSLQSSKDAGSLAFLTKPLGGQRRVLIERFLEAFGAPPPVECALFDEAVLRHANGLSFGRTQLATFDLEEANYVVCLGADFLGTWNSPVAQSIGYGKMRQGRPGHRAKLVMVEPRMSLTAANADEWIPGRPGTEGALALGLAHVIMTEKPQAANAARSQATLIEGWTEGLPDFTPENVEKRTGVPAATVDRLAREMAAHTPAVAIIGGAPLAHTNGLANALAVNALNALLGSVGRPGGMFFTPRVPGYESKPPMWGSERDVAELVRRIFTGRTGISGVYSLPTKGTSQGENPAVSPLGPVKVLLLYEANPAFATAGWISPADILNQVPFIASFGSFIDETSAFADLILPDHSPLESWLDDIPESGTTQAVVSLAPPAMLPLHSTRAMPDVLLDVAHGLGDHVGTALPWKNYEEMLRSNYSALRELRGSIEAKDTDEFWKKMQEQGGWWSAEATPDVPTSMGPVNPEHARVKSGTIPTKLGEPTFDSSESDFPFYFLPYASQMLYDGSLAHLPWMQEAPDPLTTAMWGTWVEINPATAQRLGIKQGDLVEVAALHGKLQAPALIHPGIAPDLVAMPVGQGHKDFTRYATGRGANPISILTAIVEQETGSLAWAATRVKISRVGEGKLILFGGGLSRFPHELETR